jgi:IS30 family transposase
MLRADHTFSEIARTLGKNVGSVSRHVRQYGGRDGYDTHEVRRQKRMKRITAMDGIRVLKGTLLRTVVKELKEHQSPEQIAGALGRSCASTIYRYIKERAPHLKQFLRSQKGKYRRKRGTKIRERAREQATKRRIDERPKVVERRGRLGDWDLCGPQEWIPGRLSSAKDACTTSHIAHTSILSAYSKNKASDVHPRQWE